MPQGIGRTTASGPSAASRARLARRRAHDLSWASVVPVCPANLLRFQEAVLSPSGSGSDRGGDRGARRPAFDSRACARAPASTRCRSTSSSLSPSGGSVDLPRLDRRAVRDGVQRVEGLEVRRLQRVAFGEQHGALDEIAQLAHVAGPGVRDERLARRRAQPPRAATEFVAEDARRSAAPAAGRRGRDRGAAASRCAARSAGSTDPRGTSLRGPGSRGSGWSPR